jgi:predicted  nucleic acid-binding Zn-ribbon protein
LVLEAEKEEAVSNWKDYNTALEHLQAQASTALQKEREAVEEINYQRQQTQQQQLGPQLDELNLEYQQVLYRRNQLQHVIAGLRAENQGIPQQEGTDGSVANAP